MCRLLQGSHTLSRNSELCTANAVSWKQHAWYWLLVRIHVRNQTWHWACQVKSNFCMSLCGDQHCICHVSNMSLFKFFKFFCYHAVLSAEPMTMFSHAEHCCHYWQIWITIIYTITSIRLLVLVLLLVLLNRLVTTEVMFANVASKTLKGMNCDWSWLDEQLFKIKSHAFAIHQNGPDLSDRLHFNWRR